MYTPGTYIYLPYNIFLGQCIYFWSLYLSVCCVLYAILMYTPGTHTMPLCLSVCHWGSAIDTPGMHTIASSRVTVSQCGVKSESVCCIPKVHILPILPALCIYLFIVYSESVWCIPQVLIRTILSPRANVCFIVECTAGQFYIYPMYTYNTFPYGLCIDQYVVYSVSVCCIPQVQTQYLLLGVTVSQTVMFS